MVAAISSIDTVEVSKNGRLSALNNVSAMETSLRQLLNCEYSPSGLLSRRILLNCSGRIVRP